MNNIPDKRYLQLSGTAFQVGALLGKHLEGQLEQIIDYYITEGPAKFNNIDPNALRVGAMNWFKKLPMRFQSEMEGIADGSGIPLQRVAEWGFADADCQTGCSGFILRSGADIWVGRNNDLYAPDLWGYAIHRQVSGRLGTITFGMRGEFFAATGLNEAGLWLHYNWLPAIDPPAIDSWTPYVLLTEILETCETIDEVETILKETKRAGNMLVFAVGNPHGEYALLECTSQQVARVDGKDNISGTNHFQTLSTPETPESYAPGSVTRLAALNSRLTTLPMTPSIEDLISVLADPGVEQYERDYGTVYANLYSPTARTLWFTFGGFPAASKGNWQQIPWPF